MEYLIVPHYTQYSTNPKRYWWTYRAVGSGKLANLSEDTTPTVQKKKSWPPTLSVSVGFLVPQNHRYRCVSSGGHRLNLDNRRMVPTMVDLSSKSEWTRWLRNQWQWQCFSTNGLSKSNSVSFHRTKEWHVNLRKANWLICFISFVKLTDSRIKKISYFGSGLESYCSVKAVWLLFY